MRGMKEEEWKKMFEGYCGEGATDTRDKYYMPLPVWTGGNVYFNGAKPADCEKDFVIDDEHTVLAVRTFLTDYLGYRFFIENEKTELFAGVYHNLGYALYGQAFYQEALEYYEKALEIVEKVLGKEHPYTATTYNNIAGVYEDQGDYGEALEYYLKAFKVYLDKFGMKHPSTSTIFENMKSAYESGKEPETFWPWLLPLLDEKQRAAVLEWVQNQQN